MTKKIKTAVIGMWKMGMQHIDGILQNEHAELVAICDMKQDRLDFAGEKYGIPSERRFLDWHDLLNFEGLEAVLVITPDQTHREISEAFLAAGIHVMCEKPLALTREDLDAIVQAESRSSAKFMVGQICRFTPAFMKAKELIDSGIIGEIYFVESEYAHDYYKFMHAWRADPRRHGVIGGGCHAVDLLRWLAGDPEEVFAYGTHKLLPQAGYDDSTIAVLKFPNKVIGKVFVSTGCKRPYTMRTLIYGTKGTIICDNTSDHMELYTLGPDGIDVCEEPEYIPVEVNNHNTAREYAVFASHILEDTPVMMDARQGAKTVATCMAIVESAKTGKPVTPNYNF